MALQSVRKAPERLVKTPDETRIVSFDFAGADGTEFADGETIDSGSVVSVTPSGLTVQSPATSGTELQVTVVGGTEGVEYEIEVEGTTSLGQVMRTCGVMYVGPC